VDKGALAPYYYITHSKGGKFFLKVLSPALFCFCGYTLPRLRERGEFYFFAFVGVVTNKPWCAVYFGSFSPLLVLSPTNRGARFILAVKLFYETVWGFGCNKI